MSTLASLSLHELLERIAAPTPTPGGGAVVAISAACGAALVAMVAALPRTRRNIADERATLDAVGPGLVIERARLLGLADRDAAAFDHLLATLRAAQTTEAEAAARRAAITDATRHATIVPVETAEACAEVLKAAEIVAAACNPAASADLLVAIGVLQAAAHGAAANVRANLAALDDATFADDTTRRLRAALDVVAQSADTATAAMQG